jgi:hypothetical protein
VELLQQLFVLSQAALPMAILQTLVEKTAPAELRWEIENTRQHGRGMPCPYSERNNLLSLV